MCVTGSVPEVAVEGIACVALGDDAIAVAKFNF